MNETPTEPKTWADATKRDQGKQPNQPNQQRPTRDNQHPSDQIPDTWDTASHQDGQQ